MENEGDMVVTATLLFTSLLLWGTSKLFLQLDCYVTNFEGNDTPYNLGLCIFIIVIYFYQVNNLSIADLTFLYLFVLWLTGFIDDRFGAKYPKGLKGHIRLFLQSKKISTGLFKLIGTVTTALCVTIFNFSVGSIQLFVIFLLLILTPHVMNLFDTRPLRVWKVILLHSFLFTPLIFRTSIYDFASILFIIIVLTFFEAKRKTMLGDNGATLLGGILGLFAIIYLSIVMQVLLVLSYLLIIVVAEKISLSKWIEARPFLKWFDRLGVS